MLVVILVGFLAALLIPLIFKYLKKHAGLISALLPISLFIYLASFIPDISRGITYTQNFEWVPALNINLSFYMDGLSLIFALIITGIGSFIFIYAYSYLEHYDYKDRFYIYLSIFMASMLGVVFSNNLILVYIFWELTSVSSFLLIGFKHDYEESRSNALQALLVTAGGGLAMLAGFVLIYIITGQIEINNLEALASLITGDELYVPIVILIALGAFTKSAQFPFHFWLPNAMVAPTPVSAYLHSATMVKAGIYLLARFNPVLGGTEFWQTLLVITGLVTMLFSAILAVQKKDLKQQLAYSTVSVLGILVLLIGIGTAEAIAAMLLYLIAHALYKASLFMAAGNIDHATGTRDITQVSGLRKLLPFTFAGSVLSALSKMGIIAFAGFIAKEGLYQSALNYSVYGPFILTATIIAASLIFTVGIFTGFKPYLGEPSHTTQKHKIGFAAWAGVLFPGIAGLAIGLFVANFDPFIGAGVKDILLGDHATHFALWHGFNFVFMMSLLTVALGLIISYIIYKRGLEFNYRRIKILMPESWYHYTINGFLYASKFTISKIQNGYLRYYLTIIFLTLSTLLFWQYFKSDIIITGWGRAPEFYEYLPVIATMIATTLIIFTNNRLTAVASLGVVGFSVVIIFTMYGAPDLAMTQFAIETLTVVLFVLVIYKLPKYRSKSSKSARFRDIIIAGSAGVIMSLFVLAVTADPLRTVIKDFYFENTYKLAQGKNIVNVILVDFRSFDTMGEVTVLAIAAMGVFSLLKIVKNEEKQ